MKCPDCGNTNLMTTSDTGKPFCRNCWELVTDTETGGNLRNGQTPAAKAKPRTEANSEAELVQQIKTALERRGWTVLRIGQRDVRGSGSDIGVPDLAVTHPILGRNTWRFIEVKHGKNTPTPEQQAFIDAGQSVAVWSLKEALQAIGEE